MKWRKEKKVRMSFSNVSVRAGLKWMEFRAVAMSEMVPHTLPCLGCINDQLGVGKFILWEEKTNCEEHIYRFFFAFLPHGLFPAERQNALS